ncbi:ABC transporter substrate-binding protein [Alsobacter sp. SYSU M60028]|uniref:ABC transporter substrate-binding protein n=1 Tax=Alsobacter ponti TaxID=2962936 RepID=A0ABT1LDY6_9HYPH|nr:ABC transporter substrate-binding protein [Alsobacter ponti]MCP8939715.1 ABC transporter substrate-binding protein [Alsobacter ponti]
MTGRTYVLGASLALCLAGTALSAAPAAAQESIYVPLLTYRTGPFAGSGIPIADGMADYLRMLNERDGGIGGVKLVVEECETGYDTKKGVECYESVKGKNPVVVNPYSTGITLQLIPKAAVDKIPILSMSYGLSASADGNTFPWVFIPPVTYWDGASVFIQHVAQTEGGFDKLKGKTIGLIHLDAPYGKEPIPVLEKLAQTYGFTLKLYPIAAQDMQNQSSTWLNIRRDRPNWIYIQGWGAMNPTAVKEAAKNNFPMDHLVGVWFAGGDDDARGGGDQAKGYKALNYHQAGTDFQALKDIQKFIVDKGLSKAPKDKVGENLYNRGVYNSMLIAEGIANAQKITGKKAVAPEDVRRGLEAMNITEARLKELGLEGFGSTVKLSCEDHSGHNKVFIHQWDGAKWVKASDWIAPQKDVVRPMLEASAKEYAASNAGWPKRTEPCEKSS